MWIDTHAHLNDERFDADLPEVLDRARAAGVTDVMVIGIDLASSKMAVKLSRRYPMLHAVVGMQPNSLLEVEPPDSEAMSQLSHDPTVVGIGETGLDRYWKTVPFELQQDYFRRHLALAHERRLPVVIHCREAEADVVSELERFASETGSRLDGVMHSFTGDKETARRCIELGLHVSFAGMITYKKNDALREVARSIPLDRILVETDSPYLSPEPLRGRPNEPANVVHTGARLASLFDLTPEEFAKVTTANARDLFHLST